MSIKIIHQRFEAIHAFENYPLISQLVQFSKTKQDHLLEFNFNFAKLCSKEKACLPRTGAKKIKLETKSTPRVHSQPASQPVSRLCSGIILHSLTSCDPWGSRQVISQCYNSPFQVLHLAPQILMRASCNTLIWIRFSHSVRMFATGRSYTQIFLKLSILLFKLHLVENR